MLIPSSDGRFAVVPVGNVVFIKCLLQILCCNGKLSSTGSMPNRYYRRNQNKLRGAVDKGTEMLTSSGELPLKVLRSWFPWLLGGTVSV